MFTMSLENIILTAYNALLGAGLGAFTISAIWKLMPDKFVGLYLKKVIFVIAGSFLGIYFNIARLPDLLLNLAISMHPVGIVAVGTIMLLMLIVLYRLLFQSKGAQ